MNYQKILYFERTENINKILKNIRLIDDSYINF